MRRYSNIAASALIMALSLTVVLSPAAAQVPPAVVPQPPTTAPSTAPLQTAPLTPNVPAFEQLVRQQFPDNNKQPEALPPHQQFCKDFIELVCKSHFSLTDSKKQEDFKKKWLAKLPEVKNFKDADALNKHALKSLNQRFDYYLETSEAENSKSVSDPTFVGIGVSAELQDVDVLIDPLPEEPSQEAVDKVLIVTKEHPVLLSPLKNGPAAKAGLQDGDILLQVDGKDVEGLTLKEAMKLIKGKEGTKVVLTVRRLGPDGKPVDVKPIEIMRAQYVAPVVHVRKLPGNITYIKLDNFMAAKAAEEMLEALKEAAKVTDGKIVFDLRGNGGGRLDHAINIVSYMLSEGTIVTLRKRQENQLVNVHYAATLDAVFTTQPVPFNANAISYSAARRILAVPKTMPIVILIDEHSASASELTSGAMQFHGRAKIVGMPSRGKGVGQDVTEMQGREIRITTFFFDPADRPIDFEGIHPDKEVSIEKEYKQLKDLQKELRTALAKLSALNAQLEKTVDKAKLEQEQKDLQSQVESLRQKLADLHKLLRDDPQLKAGCEVAEQELTRLRKDEAARKERRDAEVERRKDKWQKDLKEREEQERKDAEKKDGEREAAKDADPSKTTAPAPKPKSESAPMPKLKP